MTPHRIVIIIENIYMYESQGLHDKAYIELRDMFDRLLELYEYDMTAKVLYTLDYDKLCFKNVIYIVAVLYRHREEIQSQYMHVEAAFKRICRYRGIDKQIIFSRMIDID